MSLQLKKAQAEAADATTQLAAVDQLLKTLEAGDLDAIKRQYVDAVRKMAVTQVCGCAICNMPSSKHVLGAVSNCCWTRPASCKQLRKARKAVLKAAYLGLSHLQLKHAKLARQLESAAAAEKAASERVEELQEELQDCSSTCRSRMRWLEQAAADAARRTQQLYRCLQNAAPLEVCALHLSAVGTPTCSLSAPQTLISACPVRLASAIFLALSCAAALCSPRRRTKRWLPSTPSLLRNTASCCSSGATRPSVTK